MVGFSLGEITGQAPDSAEERVERLESAFAALLAAFLDLRIIDAYDHIETLRAEVGTLEVLLRLHGIDPATVDGKDP